MRQIKGIYKVKNATLQELHARAKQLIAQLEWFSIDHTLREGNREADDLANQAMDKGTGRARTGAFAGRRSHHAARIRRSGTRWCSQIHQRRVAGWHPGAGAS